ncbi:hypothetical protein O181_122331 [Austropuccinia psidii MF-1]|uniref:Uncharacterized protein n=1 Tax=Austropuccinia psidii MF-1 TaxID=1389203 RepID=A0A9Q3KLA8_9BASI|nr:hypothetical protein [Austropuccinia psidii MF-1]
MTPTRSGSSYLMQSNGSGPGNSSHKSKRQERQPRGEAQMEDARTSTSSQRLASTFDTLIESPEADITAIAVRPESLPTGSSRDIPVSIQKLVYGSKTARVGASPKSLDRNHELISSSEEAHGARKDRGTSEGIRRRSWPKARTTPQWKLPKHPPAKIRLNQCQASPKDQSEGQAKGKGKGKAQVEQALPSELQNSQEREHSHGQCVQYGRNSDGIQEQERGNIEPIFAKEMDLVKLGTPFESCNKAIMTKIKTFE